MGENREILNEITNTIAGLKNGEKLKKLLKNAICRGISVEELVENGIRKGLDIVGEKYSKGEYFLSELMFSGVMVTEALETLKPYLEKVKIKKKGTFLIGTVAGDIHDIGKNIVKTLLICRGWEVIDLGVDVPPKKFVEAVRDFKPDVVGMSSLLTTTAPMFGETINALKKAGLREKVKVIIGGNAATKEIAEEIGADGYARNAQQGIEQCERWIRNDDAEGTV